jgi:hypothetical protein
MPYPTPKVEIAFDDGPYTASPRWTDVTAYVREMTTDRGRDDDWGDFYGSASVVLDNRTRLFDPFYTSGIYYGKLLPRRQIRITATYGATSYPVFRGFITGWPPVWTDAGKDSTVTLHCFDALSLLASDNLPADWAHQYILTTSPRHYWQCNEPITPFVAGGVLKDYGSVPLNMTSSTLASNGDQLAVGLVNSSVQGTGGFAGSSATGSAQGVGNFSASMWMTGDPDTDYGTGGITYNCIWDVEFQASTNSYLVYMLDYNSNLLRQWRTTATFDGGVARMVAFTFNGTSKAIAIWVDGVSQAVTTIAASGIIPFSVSEGYYLGAGQTQQLIVWDGIQTEAVFQAIYKYSVVAFSESTAARFTRLIAETQFPASLTSPPSAPATTVLDITDDAPPTSSELQKVADSEYAPLFVDRSGVLTLYYQNQIRTQTRSIVSQGTYGAGGIAIGQDVAIAYDGDSMRNTASITMSKGGVYEQSNATSVTAYGAAEASVDTQVASLANAQAIGNIVTGWGGQVYPKADPFEVVLSPSADWSNALDRELNDRITLVIQPPTGNAITTPMLVSRISHSVVPGEWRTTFEGSARWAAAFIINQSLIGGTDLLG